MQQGKPHTVHHHTFSSIPCVVCTLACTVSFLYSSAPKTAKEQVTEALPPLLSLYVVWQVNPYPAVSATSLAMEVLPSGNRSLYTRLLVLSCKVLKVNCAILSLANHSCISGLPAIPAHWAFCATLGLRGYFQSCVAADSYYGFL